MSVGSKVGTWSRLRSFCVSRSGDRLVGCGSSAELSLTPTIDHLGYVPNWVALRSAALPLSLSAAGEGRGPMFSAPHRSDQLIRAWFRVDQKPRTLWVAGGTSGMLVAFQVLQM